MLLENTQFDMVVRLMNAALQDDSDMDLHGVAAALLPLSTVFGRKLAKGVAQFACTLIQDHAVWQNQVGGRRLLVSENLRKFSCVYEADSYVHGSIYTFI